MSILNKIKAKCREPNTSGIWKLGNILWRWNMLFYGRRVYIRVQANNCGKQILYCGSQSNGDYYLLHSVLKNIIDDYNDNYVFVMPENVKPLINELEGYRNVCYLNLKDFFSIVMYMHFDMSNKINAKDLYSWIFFNRKECFVNPPIVEFPTLNKITKQEIECIRENRTVILSPYEQTMSIRKEKALPLIFWEEIASSFIEQGYLVMTNCKNTSSEPPIKGTVACFPKFAGIHAFVEKCGYFVGMRSGLTDIIATTKAKKIILYPSEIIWEECSLINMFGNDYQIEEYIITQEWEKTLNAVIESIKEGNND